MSKNHLLKKFSIGISLAQISADEIISIMDNYKDYLHDIYFSPVEDIKFQTRYAIYDFKKTDNAERLNELSKIFAVARKNDIKLTLTLNTHMVSEKSMLEKFLFYDKRYNIDYVTTFSSIAKLIKEYNPDKHIICSYNEGIDNVEKLHTIINSDLFSTIVLGNSFLRNFQAFKMIKANNLRVKLLVNNGCISSCTNFCRENTGCKKLFEKSIAERDVSELYSEQSLFPEELHKYYVSSNLIDIYKLSCRPITYHELNDLLKSYIKGNSKDYIELTDTNYHLYGRLGHFADYYKQFDYKILMNIKDCIWIDKLA